MHETSLVLSLLRQAATILQSHRGAAVEQIRVEIGPLSGVEPLLVASAFDRLVEDSDCRGANLVIEEVSLDARCESCSREFVIERFRFVCPNCSSRSVRVVRGEEFRLLDLVIREHESAVGTSGEC